MPARVSQDSQRPNERKSSLPMLLVVFVVAVGVLSVPWIFLRSGAKQSPEDLLVADALAEREHIAGAKTYARSCAGCHEMKGQGRPGRYPTLIGTKWLLEDKETPIRLVLLGVTGPMDVNGETYDGMMPNLGVTLSDRDIAQVLTFARTSFGNDAPAITEDDVAKVRASLNGRTQPWKGGTELDEAKSVRVLSKGQ